MGRTDYSIRVVDTGPLSVFTLGVVGDNMFVSLTKALSFLFFILLGSLLRKFNVISQEERNFLPWIVMKITLPAAMIVSLSKFQMNASLLMLALLGVGANLVLIFFGWLATLRSERPDRVYSLICTPSFNVSSFVLPYAQSFLDPGGVIALSIFDTGNAMMVMGGNAAIASLILGSDRGENRIVKTLKQLGSSMPFMACVVMLILSALRISLPAPIMSIAEFAGSANGFMSMLMLGSMIDLSIKKDDLKLVAKSLSIRYLVCALMLIGVNLWLPFSSSVRIAVSMSLFAPLSLTTPVFVRDLQGNEEAGGLAASITIVISVIVMTVFLAFAGSKVPFS